MKKGYLDDFDKTVAFNDNSSVMRSFERAINENDPTYAIIAYTCSQPFTQRINSDMTKNTYHQLTLYCTPLNCYVLARTQDGIHAFISVLFHPKLDNPLDRDSMTVYRGANIEDERLLEGIDKDQIIITTTFLSTSTSRSVAEMFSAIGTNDSNGVISLFSTYRIHNHGRTALNIMSSSEHPHENEILIYPYTPFRILSTTSRNADGTLQRRFEIELEEIVDQQEDDSSPLV